MRGPNAAQRVVHGVTADAHFWVFYGLRPSSVVDTNLVASFSSWLRRSQ